MGKPTFKDVLIAALQRDKVGEFQSVNKNMTGISRATKKRAAFLQIAVTDETAAGYIHQKTAGFIIHVDGDVLNEISKELEQEQR